MLAMEQHAGVGALLADHHTYLGDVEYALTVLEAPHTDVTVAGQFAFVTAPCDLTGYADLSLVLADASWIAIILKEQNPLQNIYTFAGTGLYRARGA